MYDGEVFEIVELDGGLMLGRIGVRNARAKYQGIPSNPNEQTEPAHVSVQTRRAPSAAACPSSARPLDAHWTLCRSPPGTGSANASCTVRGPH